MRTIIPFLILAFLAINGTCTRNNWDEPCFSGSCKYDLDSSKSGSSGTLKIWGPHTAISDITTAAGWHILECDEHATVQEIRLICTKPFPSSCSHLFSHTGPENKIVRLPEKCGKNAFARVAEAHISTDQNLPPILAKRFWKRDGQLPQVYTLRFDTDFHKIDFQTMGSVRFAIEAVTIPDMEHDIDTHAPIEKRSNRLIERSHEEIVARSIQSIKNKIMQHLNIHPHPHVRQVLSNIKEQIKNSVKHLPNVTQVISNVEEKATKHLPNITQVLSNAEEKAIKHLPNVTQVISNVEEKAIKHLHNVTHVLSNAEEKAIKHLPNVTHALSNAEDKIKNDIKKTDTLHVNRNIDFGPIDFQRNITLFKQTINCPPLFPGLEVDLNPMVKANGTIGIAASGTIVPPHVADFSSVTNLSADVNATLTFLADVAAVFDSGRIKVFENKIPGLNFPGILSIEPTLQIYVQTKLTLDLVVGARIGINYYVKNALIHFPHKNGTLGTVHQVGVKVSPLKLESTPYVQAYGQTETKVIPQISLNISAFNKTTNVIIRAETSTYFRLKLEADAKSHPIIKKRNFERRNIHLNRKSTDGLVLSTRTTDDPLHRHGYGRRPSKTTTMVKRSDSPPALRKRAVKLPVGPQPTAGGRDAPTGTNTTNGPAFNGCIWIDGQLDVNFGGDPRVLFDFFDKNTKNSFFKHTWTLWKECFGTSQHKKRALHHLHVIRARSLSVPDVSPPELSSLVKRAFGLKCLSTTISAAAAEIPTNKNIQFSTTRPLTF